MEGSLRRLGTDYIDLYWLHGQDPHTGIQETMSTLDDLVRAGKVRYIGFSDAPAWQVARAGTIAELRGWAPLTALQPEYSLLARTVEGETVGIATELGLGVMPWSPLAGNLASLEVTFTDEELAALDALTRPELGFPYQHLAGMAQLQQAGAVINA